MLKIVLDNIIVLSVDNPLSLSYQLFINYNRGKNTTNVLIRKIYKLSLPVKLRLSIVLKTWQLKKYSTVLSFPLNTLKILSYFHYHIILHYHINQPQTVQPKAKKRKIKTMVITITAYAYSAQGSIQSTLQNLSLLTLHSNLMKKVLLSRLQLRKQWLGVTWPRSCFSKFYIGDSNTARPPKACALEPHTVLSSS